MIHSAMTRPVDLRLLRWFCNTVDSDVIGGEVEEADEEHDRERTAPVLL